MRGICAEKSTSLICFSSKLLYKMICLDINQHYVFRLGDHWKLCCCLTLH